MNISYAGKSIFNGDPPIGAIKRFYRMFRNLAELERNQWKSTEQLNKLSNAKLRYLIEHSYKNVPYYRRLLQRYGLKPNDFRDVRDLKKLPILAKKEVQSQDYKNFYAKNIDAKEVITHKTSGSTGLPLSISYTLSDYLYGSMTLSRAGLANGKRPWHKQAYIKNRPDRPYTVNHKKNRSRKIYLKAGCDAASQLSALKNFQPDIIYGYSNSLKLIANAAQQSGKMTGIKPVAVFGYAELLDRATRNLINSAFNVEMVDIYACIEAKCIAWECPEHKGYHINSDTTVVEFIDTEGQAVKPGESGRIIVTPLFLHFMPLIRYDTGDIGTPIPDPCSCGRGLPLMKMIQGRADDFIVLKSGTIIPPVDTFATIIENEPHVIEYIVCQEAYDFIDVKLVSNIGNNPISLSRIKENIIKLTKNEARIEVSYVDRIKRDNDSKLRRIISKVPIGYNN